MKFLQFESVLDVYCNHIYIYIYTHIYIPKHFRSAKSTVYVACLFGRPRHSETLCSLRHLRIPCSTNTPQPWTAVVKFSDHPGARRPAKKFCEHLLVVATEAYVYRIPRLSMTLQRYQISAPGLFLVVKGHKFHTLGGFR